MVYFGNINVVQSFLQSTQPTERESVFGMKKLFLTILLVLVAASFYTVMSGADRASDVPVISWRSDANPQRYEQIDMFHQWLVDNKHVTPEGKAAALLVLDTADNQGTMIQAVSGMAGDLFDTYDVPGYAALGVGIDVTEEGAENGYGFANTYPGMKTLLGRDGRQYAYPANGATVAFWINADTLAKYGMKPPALEWTPEEFEAMGKEFVKRANEGLPRQDIFFTQTLDGGWGLAMLYSIVRSKGYDLYNETLTKCVVNSDEETREAFSDVFKLFYKWTYVDHLVPTAAEVASMNTDAGYGGGDYSNFLAGKYAMIVMGRYCLIRFREFHTKINFALSQLPMYDYKNLQISARAAMLYRGSKHPELAKLFMQFLASKEYNKYIVDGADGLPPNPAVVVDEIKALKDKFPNEGRVHELEFEWAQKIAIPAPLSPYVKAGSTNWLQNSLNRYFNGRSSLEEAIALIESRYNLEIENSKEANPAVRADWDADWKLQLKIDEYKKNGKKIPAEWIKNPFHLKYYRDKGMLRETTPGGDK